MKRCTNCRARIKEVAQENCGRCGMELSGLWKVESAVEQLDRMAARMMLAGDMQQAGALLEQRQRLKPDKFIETLQAFSTE